MKYFNKDLAAVTGILMTLAGTAIPAQAAFTAITTCNSALPPPSGSLINKGGDYEVTQDLASPGGDCILITASGVSLKLNHHVIFGSGSGNGINVNPSARVNRVAIQGPAVIRGFTSGVSIVNADYSQVSQVTASGNAQNGIVANNVTFLTVASNVTTQNGYVGIGILNSANGVVQSNEMNGNGNGPGSVFLLVGGLNMSGGTANSVYNNIASGNGQFGLSTLAVGMLIQDTGTRVYGNSTDGNGRVGIQVHTTGNQIFSNTSSSGNLVYDLQDDTACGSNLWGDNAFFSANLACIH